MKKMQHHNRGFTMIELMVVVAIIGMLAVIVAPAVMKNLGRGQRTTAIAQMANLATALDTYRLDLAAYPETLEGLVKNDTRRGAWAGPYIKEVPLDPWGHAYVYTPEGTTFTLLSYGADGAPGGEGDDADLKH
ncbi:MAG: type II secretion system major pseudopilin GspG [Pseudomonadales bacterium]|jgi:general secretion pathway protein G|nr:type II secretion system major pseudopilin GspG [Pseudomonadales bacterium]